MFTSLTSVSFSITRSGVLTGVAHSGAMDRRRLRLLVRDSQPSSSSQRPFLLEVGGAFLEHLDIGPAQKNSVGFFASGADDAPVSIRT